MTRTMAMMACDVRGILKARHTAAIKEKKADSAAKPAIHLRKADGGHVEGLVGDKSHGIRQIIRSISKEGDNTGG